LINAVTVHVDFRRSPEPFLPKIVDATVQTRMTGAAFRLLAPTPDRTYTLKKKHRLTDGVDVFLADSLAETVCQSLENRWKIL